MITLSSNFLFFFQNFYLNRSFLFSSFSFNDDFYLSPDKDKDIPETMVDEARQKNNDPSLERISTPIAIGLLSNHYPSSSFYSMNFPEGSFAEYVKAAKVDVGLNGTLGHKFI